MSHAPERGWLPGSSSGLQMDLIIPSDKPMALEMISRVSLFHELLDLSDEVPPTVGAGLVAFTLRR